MPRNFFVTGSKDSGKTTLLKRLISELNLSPSGYETRPYQIEGKVTGHYFHSLGKHGAMENDLPFTIRHRKTGCLKVPEVFSLLGTAAVQASIADSSRVILMDEIGTVEKDCVEFLDLLENAFDSNKIVLGAVKKAQSSHITKLFNRSDAFCIDLDEIPREAAFKELKIHLKEILQ